MANTDTPDQVPVTVLTGYLGAGKTTLLNRILTEQHGRKYAVVINEFGELGVDNDLVVDTDEEVFEMNNGCICCTVRGDLIRILGGLMKRKGLDGILIETTGLADPAPVAQTFFVDDDVRLGPLQGPDRVAADLARQYRRVAARCAVREGGDVGVRPRDDHTLELARPSDRLGPHRSADRLVALPLAPTTRIVNRGVRPLCVHKGA